MSSDESQTQASGSVMRVATAVIRVERLEILESAKMHLTILGCLPIDQRNWPPRLQKVPFNKIHIGFTFFALISNLSLTFWFYIREVKNFADFTESVFWASRSIISLILYSMLVWQKSNLIQLFDDLEGMVNKRRQQNHVANIYEKENVDSKKYSKYCYTYAFIGIGVFFVMPIVCRSYFDYFTSDYSAESFKLFYHIVLPFNWKSPIGYIFAIIIQITFFIGVIEVFVTVFVIFLSICGFCVAFATDIEDCLCRFKRQAESCFGVFTPQIESNLYDNLCEIIQFHSDAIQFVTTFSKFYTKFLAMFFIISTSYLSIFFLRVHLDVQAGEICPIFRALIRTMAWIIGFYFVCDFGDQVTHRFQDISHEIYDCPWYEMPIKIRKHFPIMMAMSQKPFYLYGCLNIRCTRVTFRKLLYGAFSYYMVLREIIK